MLPLRNNRFVVVVGALIVLGAATAWWASRQITTLYHRQKLETLLDLRNPKNPLGLPRTPEQIEAQNLPRLKQESAWVVPMLMDDLRRPDSILDRWLEKGVIPKGLLPLFARHRTAESARHRALVSLRYFGKDGEPAVPLLVASLSQPGGRVSRALAAATTLVALGYRGPELRLVLQSLTNDPSTQIQTKSLALQIVLDPSDSVARQGLREVLHNATSPVIACLQATELLTFPRLINCAPLGPILREAVARSYLEWPIFALARVAHAVWRADGNTEMALQLTRRVWLEYQQSLPTEISETARGVGTDFHTAIGVVAQELGSIPGVADELRSQIASLPADDPMRASVLGCLERLPTMAIKPASP